MSNSQLIEKINSLPQNLKGEVEDFIEFLLEKFKKETGKEKTAKRKFGSAKGSIKMSNDFDAPLEDFKDYM